MRHRTPSGPTAPTSETFAELPIEQQVAALRAAIPEAMLLVFESYYQAQLNRRIAAAQANQQTPADPIEVELGVIDELIAEADGRNHPNGLGMMPAPNNRKMGIQPVADDPRLPQAQKGGAPALRNDPARVRRLAAIGALIVLLVAGWRVWAFVAPASEGAAQDTSAETDVSQTTTAERPTASGVEGWYPTSLEISSMVYHVIPSRSRLGGTWKPALSDNTAAWLTNTYINLVICLPPQAQALVDDLESDSVLTLRRANTGVRRYRVQRVLQVSRQEVELFSQRRTGLTMIVCGATGTSRTVVEALYEPDEPAALVTKEGDIATLDDLATLTIQAVRPVTTTKGLPPGAVLIDVVVAMTPLGDKAISADGLSDQLEIAGALALRSGQPYPEPSSEQRVTQLVYRYRVPSEGGSATWRVVASTGARAVLALTIPPAPVPTAALEAVLDANGVTPHGDTGKEVRLTIVVRNTSEQPVILEANDMAIWEGTSKVPVRASNTTTPVTLAAGEERQIDLVVARPSGLLLVQVAQQQWHVYVESEE